MVMSQISDPAQQQVRDALRRFEELASSDSAPTQVLKQTLDTLLQTLRGQAGVVWLTADDSGQKLKPLVQSGQATQLIFNDEGAPLPSVLQALGQALSRKQPIVAPPGQPEFQSTHLEQTTQFYVPVESNGKQLGVIHLVCGQEMDPKAYRQFVVFIQQASASAGQYLARRKAMLLRQDVAAQTSILRIMGHLVVLDNPKDVIHELANLVRPVLNAHRVSVVGFLKGGIRIAFSDVIAPNRKAVVVQAIEKIADVARIRGTNMTFARDQKLEGDDQDLEPLLADLFSLSTVQAVSFAPMIHDGKTVAILVVEYETTEHSGQAAPVQQEICKFVSPVIWRSIGLYDRPLRRISSGIQKVKDKPWPMTIKGLSAIALSLLLIWTLFFMSIPIDIKANARLEPRMLATATSPFPGKVVEVFVKAGQPIKAQDPLMRLDDTDFRLQLDKTLKSIEQQKIAVDTARQDGKVAEVRRGELEIEMLNLQVKIERRRIEQSIIRSPINGTVLSETPHFLLDRSVREGEKLLMLGDMTSFDLEMEVPEQDLALIADSLRAGRPVKATFLSHAWPDLKYDALITDPASISPTTSLDETKLLHVFKIVIPVKLQGTESRVALANPTGRAKLDVQPGSVAYRFGRRALRYFQITLLF